MRKILDLNPIWLRNLRDRDSIKIQQYYNYMVIPFGICPGLICPFFPIVLFRHFLILYFSHHSKNILSIFCFFYVKKNANCSAKLWDNGRHLNPPSLLI